MKMVYEKVLVIWGFKVSKIELENFVHHMGKYLESEYLESAKLDEDNKFDYVHLTNELIGRFRFKIFLPVCCSESQDYIIGRKVASYKRVEVRCNQCPSQYRVCNDCIGYTTNGHYDVISILENAIEIPSPHICKYCNNDNRELVENCKFCKHKELAASGKIVKKQKQEVDCRIVSLFEGMSSGYFYRLNDCTSCS